MNLVDAVFHVQCRIFVDIRGHDNFSKGDEGRWQPAGRNYRHIVDGGTIEEREIEWNNSWDGELRFDDQVAQIVHENSIQQGNVRGTNFFEDELISTKYYRRHDTRDRKIYLHQPKTSNTVRGDWRRRHSVVLNQKCIDILDDAFRVSLDDDQSDIFLAQ